MNNIGVIGGADGTTQIVVSGSIGGPILWIFFGALALMVILYAAFYRRGKGKAVCLALAAVFCVAASLYMTADLGTAPYDAMSFVLATTLPHLPFRAVRMAWDAAWVVLTLVLGGSVGPVTIGIMLLMGPAVDLVGGWAKRTLYRG